MTEQRRAQFISSLFGVLYGVWFTLAVSKGAKTGDLEPEQVTGLFMIFLLPFLIHLYQRTSRKVLRSQAGLEEAARRFARFEPYTYALMLAGAAFEPSMAVTLAMGGAVVLVQAMLFMGLLHKSERDAVVASDKYIAILFLISGFSALIYQVVWQRTLFTTFGINSESVTVIVSVFMFGLGVGSLAGGWLQQRFAAHLLELFLALEISIGAFGWFSLDLIHYVSVTAGGTSPAALVFWVYGILAIPTLLMGATLPILVAWLQGYLQNIGRSVGLLYAFNTIGSAIAAFATVEIIFVFTGQRAAVITAVACNLATALLIYHASRTLRARGRQANTAPAAETSSSTTLPYPLIFATLLAIGFVSLSQEILWFRLLGYMTANRPQVFGLLLAAFLVGVAGGSLKSKRLCESGQDLGVYLITALACATAVFYFALPVIAQITALSDKDFGVWAAYLAIGTVAYFTGGILPVLIHIGIGEKGSTKSMSWLYFANIIGATAGPLLTGFILLDRFTLEQNIAIITVLTIVLLLVLIAAVPTPQRHKRMALAQLAVLAVIGIGLHNTLFEQHLEKLQYANLTSPAFKYTLQNKSGIIAVEASEADIMYGHGVYDGRFNIDPILNLNRIDRTYMIAGLHRKPLKVLDIGLSTGSWVKVMTDYAPLEEMTVVEINPGYVDIIKHYPDIASLFDSPKVKLHIDDGRRWLRNHPDAKFDLILMNTTYYWRSNSTNLLSSEFLEQCKRHLNPGGVVYYNTTGSNDVVYTAASVFKHVTVYSNFVAASDAPFDMTREEKRANMLQFRGAGVAKLFDKDKEHRNFVDWLADKQLEEWRDPILMHKELWRITDDNMAVEYKTAH